MSIVKSEETAEECYPPSLTTFVEEQRQQQQPSTTEDSGSNKRPIATMPLDDSSFESKFDVSAMQHDSAATVTDLLGLAALSSNLDFMQPHEETENTDGTADVKPQMPLESAILNETAASGCGSGETAYTTTFTTADSQQNLYYYSSTGPVAYYSTASGEHYFPVESHTSHTALYQQNAEGGPFQWHAEDGRAVAGNGWSHTEQQPYGYEGGWSAQESEGRVKEEHYDESSLFQTVNFDHSHRPTKRIKTTDGSGPEVANGQARENNFATKEESFDQEFASIEDLVSRHLLLLSSPVDENAQSHTTAHSGHMPVIQSSSNTTLCHPQPLSMPALLVGHSHQATSSRGTLAAQMLQPSTSTAGSIEASQAQNVDPIAKGTYTLTGEKIRRPPNAFMIFAKDRRREILFSNRELTNKEVSKLLGLEWHALPEEEKAKYKQTSELLRHEHQLKYPGYYYSPVEARLEKAERMRKYEERKKAFNKRKNEAP